VRRRLFSLCSTIKKGLFFASDAFLSLCGKPVRHRKEKPLFLLFYVMRALLRKRARFYHFSSFYCHTDVNLQPIVLSKDLVTRRYVLISLQVFYLRDRNEPDAAVRRILMNKKNSPLTTPYLEFTRKQWAALRNSVPMTLTEEEIAQLKGINEDLSLEEVAEIYLPLSRLLNFYISSNLRRQAVLEQFLGTDGQKIPYIISIAGSVAVGKSTTARVLQALLSRWPEHRKVELITTDGFLHPNAVLKERGLMKKKGFPQSYDMHRLVNFVSALKSGASQVTAPVYSHLVYDVIPDGDKVVHQPDILILEGLNVLQSGMDYPHDPHHVFVSDFVDFSIYVDAPEELLQRWYINRFLKFRQGAFTDPDSYFHHYAQLSEEEAVQIATGLWKEINWLNLQENILPTRERASLIMTKGGNHAVDRVRLRK